MDSNEEYLDQLLKSLTEGTSSETAEGMDDSEQDNGLEDLLNQFSDETDSVPQELLSGLMGSTENMSEKQSDGNQGDEPTEEGAILSDMIQDMTAQDSGEQAEPQQPETAEEEEQEPQQPEVLEEEEQEPQQPEVAEEEGQEFQQPEMTEEEEQETQQPALDKFEQAVSEPDGESESDMAWETEFDMFKDPESEMSEQAESDISEQVESDISEQAEFDVSEQPEFDMAEQPGSDMEQPEDSEQGDDDLSSLLESLGAEGQEISDLLDKAEQDEPLDMVDSLMQELNEELSPDARYAEEDYSDEAAELLERPGKRKKKKEKVKKEKVKKEKVKKEKKPRGKRKQEVQEPVGDPSEESTESIEEGIIESVEDGVMITTQQEAEEIISAEAEKKKQGFWSKLLNALIQEDEDEEEPTDLISDENGAILEELDKEKKQAKGKKKKGKDKKGKDKRAAESEDDDELEEDSKGKGKKKKEKKPKKEKPPVPAEDLLPGKKLPLKKVMSIMLVMLVLGLAYVLVSHLYIDYVNKKGAEKAYYAGDYMECYSLLFGQDRNENQDLMYHRSELALQMERMKGNYRRMVMEGKELEALDYLVQCVCHKEASYLQAQEWNCMDIVEETYAGMIGLMTANYGLSEERAAEIVALKSDVDYTLALIEVLEERGSDSTEGDESEQQEPISYEDLLPEEEENSDAAFVDTME